MALRVGCSHENLLLEQESPCRRSSCTPSPAPAPRHKWVTNFDLNCLPNRQANISLPQGITVKPAASCAFTSILPPLPFPKLQSCCSSRLGRAATSQFREGKGREGGAAARPPAPPRPPHESRRDTGSRAQEGQGQQQGQEQEQGQGRRGMGGGARARAGPPPLICLTQDGGSCKTIWTHWDLNPGPSACEADVIPLHHVPLVYFGLRNKKYQNPSPGTS